MDCNFSNKTVLITGATGGIGNETARLFCKNGANVILTGSRETVLQQMVTELGDRVHYHVCNLANEEEAVNLIGQCEEKYGDIDILVNNAGITKDGLTLRMKIEDWQNVMDINLKATFILCKAVLRGMSKRRYGRIINISSIIGLTGNAGQVNYAASKAAIIAMSKSLAREFAMRGITVNSIAPGYIDTPMTDAMNEQIKEEIIKKIPLGRTGAPEEIAHAIAYLASDRASYITGETLNVNGGMMMN